MSVPAYNIFLLEGTKRCRQNTLEGRYMGWKKKLIIVLFRYSLAVAAWILALRVGSRF
jgi:hypothetical protein